jgi:acyl-CoA thioesterase
MAAIDLTTLPEVLRLERIDDHRFALPDWGDGTARDVVFGGQILAQMIVASSLADASGAKEVKSVQCIFARAASFGAPLELQIEPMHAGRTFASDTVTLWQGDRLCARALLLLHADEPDLLHHGPAMPDVPGPLESPDGSSHGLVFPGAEVRVVGAVNPWDPDEPVGPAEMFVWTRYPGAPASVAANQAIVSWATDGYLIGASMRPYPEVNEYQAHRSISTGVVGHTLHFHNRLDARDWLLLAHDVTWAGRGVIHGRALVFDQAGTLVASFTQDAMVRHFADGSDHAADYQHIM